MSGATPRRGLLIAIEGIDGVGKSSVLRGLLRRWRRRGLIVAAGREPTDRRLGRQALSVAGRDPGLAAILFTLDRARQRPELERRLRRCDVVLLDRSFYSTLAYQGSALGVPARRSLLALQRAVALRPDRVVWLDMPVSAALERVGRRGTGLAPTERRATLHRVAAAYRELAQPRRWRRFDARRPLGELLAEVDAWLAPMFARRRRPGASRG